MEKVLIALEDKFLQELKLLSHYSNMRQYFINQMFI